MDATIKVTCDNYYKLYVNGAYIGTGANWHEAQSHSVTFNNGDNIVSMQCKNFGGVAGLIGTIEWSGGSAITDSSWEVSMDNSTWESVKVVGSLGIQPWGNQLSFNGSPKWVWINQKVGPNTVVYFRKTVTVSDESTPAPTYPDIVSLSQWNSILTQGTARLTSAVTSDLELKGFERFLTPNEASVVAKVDELGGVPQNCYNWVCQNITYVSDQDNYMEDEKWCFPAETLEKGSGDCEDQAFLIASMFMRLGIECFVRTAYLINMGGGHAWCYFKWDEQWFPAETTSTSFDPWGGIENWPQYGPYIPWVDIKENDSHNYTGSEQLSHALRIKHRNYTDGAKVLPNNVIMARRIIP